MSVPFFDHQPPPGTPPGALHAPATLRNRTFILDVLRQHLPARGHVLEIASGTGEHAVFFASHLLALTVQPSDPDPENRASILAWRAAHALPNLAAPLDLDVGRLPWPVTTADAIVNINMIHIAPWSACEALMSGAGALLPAGGVLYMYGPYKRDGKHTAESNERFDASLRARDPAWGVRNLEEVAATAAGAGLDLTVTIEMPANNLSLVFRRR